MINYGKSKSKFIIIALSVVLFCFMLFGANRLNPKAYATPSSSMNDTRVDITEFHMEATPVQAKIEVSMDDIGLVTGDCSIIDTTNSSSVVTIDNVTYTGGKAILSASGMNFFDSYTLNIEKSGYDTYSNNTFFGTLAAASDLDMIHELNMFPSFTRALTSPGVVTISNSTFAAGARLYAGGVYDAIDTNNGHPDNGSVTRLIGMFGSAPNGAKAVKTLRTNGLMVLVDDTSLIDSNPNYQETVHDGIAASSLYKDTIAFLPMYSTIASAWQSPTDHSRTLVDSDDRYRIIEWYGTPACDGTPIKITRLLVKTEYTGNVNLVPLAPTAPLQDDAANTFGWTNAAAFVNASDYEYSVDNGSTWTTASANPQNIGNMDYATGTVQVRVKADVASGRVASAALVSTADYTAQHIHLVHNSTTTDYAKIQDALNASADGDTINADAGTYREQLTITKNITLQGAAENQTIIEAPNRDVLAQTGGNWRNLKNQDVYAVIGVKTTAAGMVTIKNLTVDGRDQGLIPDNVVRSGERNNYSFQGIGVYNSTVTVDTVKVTGVREKASDYNGYVEVPGYTDEPSGMNHNEGIFAESALGQPAHTLTITNSYITKFQKTAILVWGPTLTVDINHNTIQGYGKTLHSSGNGIQISSTDRTGQGESNGDRRGTTGSITNNQLLGIGQVVPVPGNDGSYLNLGQGGPAPIILNEAGANFLISGNTIIGTGYSPWYNADTSRNSDGYANDGIDIIEGDHVAVQNNTISGFFAAIHEQSAVTGSYLSVSGNTLTGNSIDIWPSSGNDSITLSNGNASETIGYIYAGSGVDQIDHFGVGDKIQVIGFVNGSINGYIGTAAQNYPGTTTPIGYTDAHLVVDFTGGTVTSGDGTAVAAHSVQVAISGNSTTLYVDTDGTAGAAELQIHLNGIYSPQNFALEGGYIKYVYIPSAPSNPVYTQPVPQKEVISVDVTNAATAQTVAVTTIERTTETNGIKKDLVIYQEDKAKETVEKLKSEGQDTARIVIPDAKDEVSEAKVNLPKTTLTIVGQGNINLEIDTENARITVPKESLQDQPGRLVNSANEAEDLFFRIVPIKDEEQKQKVEERAKQEAAIKEVAHDNAISVVGRPMTIETNMSERPVDITLPLKGVTIPTDPREREAFLNSLAVFIEHSDGEKVLVKAEIVSFKPGVLGLRFRIKKFSTFTIIKLNTPLITDQKPVITLAGSPDITLRENDAYTDQGATAVDANGIDLTKQLVSSGAVDTSKPGDYTIVYTVKDAYGNEGKTLRTIHVISTTKPVIALKGDKEITIKLNELFTDPGVTATDNQNHTITDKVIVDGVVNTGIPGDYKLIYRVTDAYGNSAEPATRTLHVINTAKPVITLRGAAAISIKQGETFKDPGVLAIDNQNNTITDKVIVEGVVKSTLPGKYKLVYKVTDVNGNSADPVERTVQVINTAKPVITLRGAAEVSIKQGQLFMDPGATATDNQNKSITNKVIIEGTVDSNVPGDYELIYKVTDAYGNIAIPMTRIIHVINTTKPVITLKGTAKISIKQGEKFEDPGATATDNQDNEITDRVVVVGIVDTNVPGDYKLVYKVMDAYGNSSDPVDRTIHVINTTKPVITLKGAAKMSMKQGEVFKDPGFTAKDNQNKTLTNKVAIEGSVDTNVPGEYKLIYKATDVYGNSAIPVTRTVYVISTTKPVITLKGAAEISIKQGDAYVDPGFSAMDNQNNTLTDRVVVEGTVDTNVPGDYRVIYKVTDENGNRSELVIRIIHIINTTKPIIHITGSPIVTITVNDIYTDEGATATDNQNHDVTDQIVASGVVDTTTAGDYIITYNVVDSFGNVAESVTRTIRVVKPVKPNVQPAKPVAETAKPVKVQNKSSIAIIAGKADGISGSVLAARTKALLLTPGNYYLLKLNKKITTVLILGGVKAVDKSIATQIRKYGIKNMSRIGGGNAYETSSLIVDYMKIRRGTPMILISNKTSLTLVKAMISKNSKNYPILMTPSNSLSSYTKKSIAGIKPSMVYIIGDGKAVSTVVEKEMHKMENKVIRMKTVSDLTKLK